MNKVVITGMGVISSLGTTLDETWDALLNGKSGVKLIDTFDVTNYRTQFAASINDEQVEKTHARKVKKRARNKMSRAVYLNQLTAQMAVEDSGVDFEYMDKNRCGVVIGATGTEQNPDEIIPLSEYDDSRIIKTMSNAYPAWISLRYGLEGPSMTVGTACASANYAISWAYDQIALDRCDLVIAGGASCPINPELLKGFSQMMALSERNTDPSSACRPFDRERDGFVMGEGAGVLILESEASAKNRGARIYAELRQPALTSEAYNIVAPQKDGVGMAKCMENALRYSKINREDIQYINAHGTSTRLNDEYETKAIKSVLGPYANKVSISSTKSMTGHCLAAAGGIEAVITVKAIYENILPPTINLDHPGEGLDLDYIPWQPKEISVKAALSNSFAFGGHNAVLPFVSYL